MSNQKNWKAKLLLVCISLLVSVAALELGLRVAGFSRPYFYAYDQDLGWVLRPATSGWFRKEGEAYVRINNQGMRDDRDYAAAKPPGTFRIAVLGDSYAEALQLPVSETFWSVVGKNLTNCLALANRKVEVLNFGVSSYGTAQELIMLRDRVWAFSPDLVLLAFTPANDVRNNSRILEKDELRPYFILQNGTLVADMSFRDSPSFRQKESLMNRAMYRLINCSRLLQLINGIREDRAARRLAQQQAGAQAGQSQTATTELGIDIEAYQQPRDAAWAEAWHVTEALLSQMNKEVKEHNARLVVVTVTSGPQTNPDESARQRFLLTLQSDDLFYVERRIQELSAREHFPVLTLAEPFVSYASEHQVALHGFGAGLNVGHWNAAGHQLAGAMIADHVCRQLGSY